MKRLLELNPDSALVAKAQRLVAAADPIADSEERRWRIRRELDRPRSALAVFRRLPAFGVAGVLLLFGATAYAAVRVVTSAVANFGSHPDAEAARLPAAAPIAHATPPAAASAAPSVPTEVAALQPSEVVSVAAPARVLKHSQLRERVKHPRRAVHPGAQRRRTQAPVAVAETDTPALPEESPARERNARSTEAQAPAYIVNVEDSDLSRKQSSSAEIPRDPEGGSELVHRALKALRRDHDPELALRLLARHREVSAAALRGGARDPEGALAEETLALQIEAASLTDPARARAFAREYLARFAGGRYRSAAERALQAPAP